MSFAQIQRLLALEILVHMEMHEIECRLEQGPSTVQLLNLRHRKAAVRNDFLFGDERSLY